MDDYDWNQAADDERGLSSPDAFPYQELLVKLRQPLAMLVGGLVLSMIVFYGLGSVFGKPAGYQIAGRDVDRLKIGDAVYHGETRIGTVRGLEESRRGAVADLEIDKQFLKLVADGPEFRVLSGWSGTRVVMGAESDHSSTSDQLMETVGQFTGGHVPPIASFVAMAVIGLFAFWALKMVLGLAKSAFKMVGFALIVGCVVIAGLIFLGQFN
jgi:hypothetical protein